MGELGIIAMVQGPGEHLTLGRLGKARVEWRPVLSCYTKQGETRFA